MPDSRSLDTLRTRLYAAMSPPAASAPKWGNPGVMTEVLHQLQRDLGGAGDAAPARDVLLQALEQFQATRKAASFTELKYVCYGVTVPVGANFWRLIDRSILFDALLTLVKDYEAQPRQFRRCYQGLLNGYFGFDRYTRTDGSSGENWHRLRDFLNDQLNSIVRAASQRGTTPEWLQTLHAHKNLLTDDPCSRYAKGFKQGNAQELKDVCVGLGISGASWVWQDALVAYVRLVCEGVDTHFLNQLPRLLDLVDGRAEIKLPAALATQATAMVVIRYCACVAKPEHAGLRDTCLHWIGNPWIHRTAWDAHVNHEPARQMVNGWLKRRLIKDFFELLALDGAADLRRLHYWLKWEPQISDMWFVLGTDARNNHSAAFIELRKNMTGRDRVLTGNDHQNNAFVMRIDQLLVIEFGVTGNACYVFAAADFHTSLERKYFSIPDLKQKAQATRLKHQSYWEGLFDYQLRLLLQSVPLSKGVITTPAPDLRTQPARPLSVPPPFQSVPATSQAVSSLSTSRFENPASVSAAKPMAAPVSPHRLTQVDFNTIQLLCQYHGVEWENNLYKNGALWVLIPDRRKRVGFASLLDRYGFHYKEGQGFWLKEQE